VVSSVLAPVAAGVLGAVVTYGLTSRQAKARAKEELREKTEDRLRNCETEIAEIRGELRTWEDNDQ